MITHGLNNDRQFYASNIDLNARLQDLLGATGFYQSLEDSVLEAFYANIPEDLSGRDGLELLLRASDAAGFDQLLTWEIKEQQQFVFRMELIDVHTGLPIKQGNLELQKGSAHPLLTGVSSCYQSLKRSPSQFIQVSLEDPVVLLSTTLSVSALFYALYSFYKAEENYTEYTQANYIVRVGDYRENVIEAKRTGNTMLLSSFGFAGFSWLRTMLLQHHHPYAIRYYLVD